MEVVLRCVDICFSLIFLKREFKNSKDPVAEEHTSPVLHKRSGTAQRRGKQKKRKPISAGIIVKVSIQRAEEGPPEVASAKCSIKLQRGQPDDDREFDLLLTGRQPKAGYHLLLGAPEWALCRGLPGRPTPWAPQ